MSTPNPIQMFSFEDKTVRILINDETGEPWWVAKDVCEVLGYAPTRISELMDRLDSDEKGYAPIVTPGGTQNLRIINESGLYNLVLRSEKPEAKTFKRWVTHEVLPTIRKTGRYEIPTSPKHTPIQAEFIALLKGAVQQLEENALQLAQKDAVINELSPKANFHDKVAIAINAQPVDEVAKMLGTGRDRLFAWLREKEYLIGSYAQKNIPYQKWIDNGCFRVVEGYFKKPNGETMTYPKTLITGKGFTRIQREFHPLTGLSDDPFLPGY